MGKVLVIALDGLDKKLITECGIECVRQDEFGTIDNSTGINSLVTTELFASFITGETSEVHGVVDLGKKRSNLLNTVETKINTNKLFRKTKGLRSRIYNLIPYLDSTNTYVTRKDLSAPSFFEEVSPSKAIDVPAYSTGYHVKLLDILEEHGVSEARQELERFTQSKKRELFESLEDDYSLVMAHFHKPDHIHHWYWEVGRDQEVKDMYKQIDSMCAEITEKAKAEDFDTIILMSDHGLPDVESGGHNENAFYSCNHELFGDKTPHITDFHDEIVELAETRESELTGIEV